MAPPVAIMALDGMQSHRLAAPPTTSRSIRVTSTPRRAALVAAWFPAGPPPMITNRMSTGYGQMVPTPSSDSVDTAVPFVGQSAGDSRVTRNRSTSWLPSGRPVADRSNARSHEPNLLICAFRPHRTGADVADGSPPTPTGERPPCLLGPAATGPPGRGGGSAGGRGRDPCSRTGRPFPVQASAEADAQGVAVDAAAFSTGACLSFPPTHGDRHLTVFLDAGHGGIDPGGVGTTEKGKTIDEADRRRFPWSWT